MRGCPPFSASPFILEFRLSPEPLRLTRPCRGDETVGRRQKPRRDEHTRRDAAAEGADGRPAAAASWRRASSLAIASVSSSPHHDLQPGAHVLGRYTVLGKLTQGGMAEVYLGRTKGETGFEKLVAVKQLRPHVAMNKSFIKSPDVV